jgi:hypothetical protein
MSFAARQGQLENTDSKPIRVVTTRFYWAHPILSLVIPS